MRVVEDTTRAEGTKRLCFTCGARETQALNSLGPVRIRHTPWERLRFTCATREAEVFGT